ncbi:MAG: sulfite exporter TauE/SafE family protein [Candidatus Zixiibacteriota bacterium]|nr:MAG: sulfite exporter TauE/SafE family protein [candidate division Zixibacteria bacterium]
MFTFPISGVETWWWLPALVAFAISSLTSTGGVSGAFLLLPFQVSFLGFTGPAVSSTNLVYNIVATPGGVYRYFREGRMVWPLMLAIIIGILPGFLIGAIIRVVWLADPSKFKFFVGLVLLYLGGRLFYDLIKRGSHRAISAGTGIVTNKRFRLMAIEFEYGGNSYSISTFWIYVLTFTVGIIAGAYGIGGGSIIAPFLLAIFGLPVYVIAGPTLFGTFISSVAGVAIYYFLVPVFVPWQPPINPDWLLGLSFGAGGLLGTYVGARMQKFIPARVIKLILMLGVFYISIRYITGFFAG